MSDPVSYPSKRPSTMSNTTRGAPPLRCCGGYMTTSGRPKELRLPEARSSAAAAEAGGRYFAARTDSVRYARETASRMADSKASAAVGDARPSVSAAETSSCMARTVYATKWSLFASSLSARATTYSCKVRASWATASSPKARTGGGGLRSQAHASVPSAKRRPVASSGFSDPRSMSYTAGREAPERVVAAASPPARCGDGLLSSAAGGGGGNGPGEGGAGGSAEGGGGRPERRSGMCGCGLTANAACRTVSSSHSSLCCCPPVSTQGRQQ